MALNIFPRRKEQAAPEPLLQEEILLPEPSPEALEDSARARTRRGTRGGRGRRRPGAAAETPETPEIQEEAPVSEPQPAPARRPARAPRAKATPAAVVEETPVLAPPAEEPAPRAPRATRARTRPAPAPAEPAPIEGATPETTAILRAIEAQSRQIEQLIRLQEESGRRGPAGAPGAPPQRVGIFVDTANVELACDRLRVRFDWGKILAMLTKDRHLVRAVAYAPVHDDPNVSLETQRFAEPFLDRGYKIVTKPLKRFQDGTVKANIDIELTLDIIEMLDRLDVVCLVSGDGDFVPLVEVLQGKGVRVEVVAVGASTAGNLRHAADLYIDLATRQREIRA
jgi:uncharacterized LabA/DUF88 family protein